MSEHTSGPWTASIGTRGAHVNMDNDYNHPLSFGVGYDESMAGEAEANILLIAAAPDLLAACKRVYDAMRLQHGYNAEEIREQLNAAIQKAEPKSASTRHDPEKCGWDGIGTCPVCGEDVGRVL